ncbi:MAG: nucleotidyltransferase domain-containing protein [Nanoarchaeota archaeon]|nr:nucleotidyltransferase domain-containing protein [Nanoarchaeota archaeon]MBU1135831.1 nucleotidyltransferase domain-containing protein [Nanoarchaeota archaeon]MBU2520126.1 nucleotidyltransferase domain-containing protein [Nanoarchaeota archaeon]
MKNLFPYIYDYISVLFENIEIKRSVKKVILFGSVARGEFDKESDIDVFLEVSSSLVEKTENLVRKSEKRFSLISEKKWIPLRIKNPIKTIVGDLEEPRWKELKLEIISYGITLYGKFESLPEKLSHHALFTYSLSGLPQKRKMKFLRTFFGYRIKKKTKLYEQIGIVEEIGGKKLGSNSILIPLEKSRDVQKFFNNFKITPEIREIWMKS